MALMRSREHPPGNPGEVILVISGQSRRMYQSLEPSSEGTIFRKRSSLRGSTDLLTMLPPFLQVA
jgi:hypothetical protein